MTTITGEKGFFVPLPYEDIITLTKLAQRQNLTMTDALIKAIRTELFIQDELNRGSRFLIEEPGRTIRVITFP